jgi:hypothetical protein
VAGDEAVNLVPLHYRYSWLWDCCVVLFWFAFMAAPWIWLMWHLQSFEGVKIW